MGIIASTCYEDYIYGWVSRQLQTTIYEIIYEKTTSDSSRGVTSLNLPCGVLQGGLSEG
jgi:hypothetical protein